MSPRRAGLPEPWRAYDEARLAREMSPSSAIGGDYAPVIARYHERSAAARAALRPRLDLPYGPSPDERLDLYPATVKGAPLLVYFHGGYWQELSKAASAFAAADCVAAGCGFAAVGYTLAPRATPEAIVGQCRRALRWIVERAASLDADPRRIVVAGSSAGAHLAAMALRGPWRDRSTPEAAVEAATDEALDDEVDDAGDPCDPGGAPPVRAPVAGAVLVSGVYDLRPLVGTYVNDALGLDEPRAAAASPLLRDWRGAPPTLVAWGAVETAEFVRQSRAFAAALAADDVPVATLQAPERNHFDIVLELADPRAALGRATLALLRGDPPPLGAPAARVVG